MQISRRVFLAATGLGTVSLAGLGVPQRALAAGPQTSDLSAVSGTTRDAAPSIRSYLATRSGSVALTGDYFLDSAIEIPPAISAFELTAGSRLKVRGDHSAITRTGSIRYRELAAAAMAKGQTAITVVKPAAYAVNEYLLVSGDDSVADAPDHYGYLRRVTKVSGSTVQLDKSLPRSIAVKPRTSAVSLSPALKIFGAGEILHTTPASSFSPLVVFMAVLTPQIIGLELHDNGATGVAVAHCKGGLVDCTIRDLLDDGENHFGYGVNVTGSTRGLVVRGTMTRVRHAVTTNTGPSITSVGSAGEPEDCWFEPVAIDCSDKSVDTHRLGWNTTIVPHITGGRGGVQIRADNTHVIGGTISGCSGPGISVSPLVAIAPTIEKTIISALKPSGVALLADSAVIATDLDIRDSYGTNIVLQSNSRITGGSITAGGSVGVQFRGSNNTVTGIKLGSNVTTPYIESSGATNNVFTPSTESPTPLPAPRNTTTPKVTGTLMVGERLSIDDGTWDVGPLTFTFTWLRNGVAISGATDRTYRTYDVVSADLDAALSVRVTAKRAGYQTATALSSATTPIRPGAALKPTTAPVLSGTAKPAQTLTVTRGTWNPSAQSTKCAWLRNGVPTGDTGTTYRVKTSDVGKKISVTVTAARTGFTSGTYTTPGKTVAT